MKRSFLTALITAGLLCTFTSAASDKPVKATSPLSPDQVSIYKAVLQQYADDKDTALNVSQNTYPFDSTSPLSGLQGTECLKGVHLEDIPAVSRSFHELPPDVLPGKKMKLVDPQKQAAIVHSNDP